MIARLALSAGFVLAGLSGPEVSSAQWVPNGVPVCDLPLCGGQGPQVCSDDARGAFVVWVDLSHAASDYDISIQHLTGSGAIAPGWPVGGITVCAAPGIQAVVESGIAPDGAGGVLLAWLDYRGGPNSSVDIYAVRVTAEGTLAPGWAANGVPVCTAPGYQSLPRLVADGAGGAIIVWVDERKGFQNSDIYAQHLTATGEIATGWIPDGLPICTANGFQGNPFICPDGAGGAFVAWGDGRDSGAAVYAQHITGAGAIADGWVVDGTPIHIAPGLQTVGAVVTDGAGGAFIAWQDGASELSLADWHIQRVTTAGGIAEDWPAEGVPIVTAPDNQLYLKMVQDGFGGVLCSWDDYRPVGDADVYAHRITASGVRAPGWGENGVRVSIAPSYQFASQLAPDGAGGAYIVFESIVAGYTQIFAQRLTAQGTVAAGFTSGGTSLVALPGEHNLPAIAPDGRGGAIAAWEDGRHSLSQIFAQRVVADGPVPVLVALVSAEAKPGRVALTWFAATRLEGTVFRRATAGAWDALGVVASDGSGYLRYEDRAVSPGSRHAYRLGYREQGEEFFSPETWVEVPAALTFALEGLRPNPAIGDVAVSFTLPTAAPATLEVLDVSGRRVVAREVGSLGPGRQLLPLQEGNRLPPGIYWIRLTQSERALMARGVVVR